MFLLAQNSYDAEFGSEPKTSSDTEVSIWQSSDWIPIPLDGRFESLAVARLDYITCCHEAGTNIDTDVEFDDAEDIVRYLPRAFTISLFAPFPSMWFDKGSSEPYTVMRRVSGLEMTIAYISFLGLLLVAWYKRNKIEFWVILIFCLAIIVSQGLVVANIGTLYRFRYGPFMMLVCLGWTGLLHIMDQRVSITL